MELLAWKGYLKIGVFKILLFLVQVVYPLTAALTNMKLGREIKLRDVTNIVMVKVTSTL